MKARHLGRHPFAVHAINTQSFTRLHILKAFGEVLGHGHRCLAPSPSSLEV